MSAHREPRGEITVTGYTYKLKSCSVNSSQATAVSRPPKCGKAKTWRHALHVCLAALKALQPTYPWVECHRSWDMMTCKVLCDETVRSLQKQSILSKPHQAVMLQLYGQAACMAKLMNANTYQSGRWLGVLDWFGLNWTPARTAWASRGVRSLDAKIIADRTDALRAMGPPGLPRHFKNTTRTAGKGRWIPDETSRIRKNMAVGEPGEPPRRLQDQTAAADASCQAIAFVRNRNIRHFLQSKVHTL